MKEVTLTLHRRFEKGALSFDLPAEPALLEALKKVLLLCRDKNNDYVKITLERPFKPRTTGKDSQNHHLNGHIVQICNETGNDYDAVKYCVKMIAVEQLGFPSELVAGHVIPKRERDCSVEECTLLIEAAHILAAELGLILKE